jgi:hypothetical protein
VPLPSFIWHQFIRRSLRDELPCKPATVAWAWLALAMRSTRVAPDLLLAETVSTAILSGTNCLCRQFGHNASKTSQLRRGEGVAAADLARLQAGVEPALALLGTPVREGVGNDVALRLTLERLVADRSRGA